MKLEFSAGGIVCKKTLKGVDILLCQSSLHHGWGFPKGLIGDHIKDEGKEETALREVEEETGVKGKILKTLSPVTYWYKFEDEKIKKTVYYFVMEYIDGDITKHDFEMENVEWVEKNKVLDRLTFKSDKEVYKNALPIVENIITNKEESDKNHG